MEQLDHRVKTEPQDLLDFLDLSDLLAQTERGDWTEQRVIPVSPELMASKA